MLDHTPGELSAGAKGESAGQTQPNLDEEAGLPAVAQLVTPTADGWSFRARYRYAQLEQIFPTREATCACARTFALTISCFEVAESRSYGLEWTPRPISSDGATHERAGGVPEVVSWHQLFTARGLWNITVYRDRLDPISGRGVCWIAREGGAPLLQNQFDTGPELDGAVLGFQAAIELLSATRPRLLPAPAMASEELAELAVPPRLSNFELAGRQDVRSVSVPQSLTEPPNVSLLSTNIALPFQIAFAGWGAATLLHWQPSISTLSSTLAAVTVAAHLALALKDKILNGFGDERYAALGLRLIMQGLTAGSASAAVELVNRNGLSGINGLAGPYIALTVFGVLSTLILETKRLAHQHTSK